MSDDQSKSLEGTPQPIDDDLALSRVWRVLARETEIDALSELKNGLEPGSRRPGLPPDARIAFGFDTNAIYRLGLNGTQGADAVDYLSQQHEGPLIIPGQAIQEVWNNLLAGVEPQAKRIRKKFEELTGEIESIDQQIGPAGETLRTAIQEFVRVHGEWIDPASQEVFDATLDALIAVGHTSYVPRFTFYRLAQVRKETKTPPGFQDPPTNHGDFFLWADFLYGLARSDMDGIDATVLVTNDSKSDWSRHGVAHPVLVAEAVSITGLPFRLWSLGDFHRHVKARQGLTQVVVEGSSGL